MIILAGAIILVISNNNVITEAQGAVKLQNLQQVQEIAQTAWLDAYAGGEREESDLKKTVDTALEENKVDTTKYEITVTDKGVTVKLKEDAGTEEDNNGDNNDTQPTADNLYGVWVFNETINLPSDMIEQLVEFTSNGRTFSRIATGLSDQGFILDPGESALYYGGSNYFYSTGSGWDDDAYRTVDFGTEG